MQVKENGKLSVEIIEIKSDYHLLTDEEKIDLLLLLQKWLENELDQLL